MTERKPLGTNFESWIEAQLHSAVEEGAFDNLPGAGTPLGQDFDPDWWVKQLMEREGISTMLPPSLELVRKVRTELDAIQTLGDETAVRRRIAALNAEIAKLNATMVEGPPTRVAVLDIDQVVAKWQQARAANRQ